MSRTWFSIAVLAATACAAGPTDDPVEEDPIVDGSGDEKADRPLASQEGALVTPSGKCMNVRGAQTADGTPMILWDCVGAANERLRYYAPNSTLTAMGKCLTAAGGGTANGTRVVLSSCNGSAGQRWTAGTTDGRVRSTGGRCVTTPSNASGAELVLRDCGGSDSQKWIFERELVMRLQAVLVSDDNGGRGPATGAADAIDGGHITTFIERMNQTYAPAHIRFVFDPASDLTWIRSTDINNLTCDGGNPPSTWDQIGKAQTVAARAPGKIVVYFRNGPQAGREWASCSSGPVGGGGNSIVFQSFFDDRNVMAHEMGHYLGLDHTFTVGDDGLPLNTTARVAAHLQAHGGTLVDADGLGDTPPDPGAEYWDMYGWNRCTGPASFTVDGVTLAPDRSNVMSYYGCEPGRFSRQQIVKMRTAALHPMRRGLVEAAPPKGSPREIFGHGGKCLTASDATPRSGSLVQMSDCVSSASQLWRFGTGGEIMSGNGLCLHQAQGSNNARPFLAPCSGSPDGVWLRAFDGDLVSQSGRCLDVRGASFAAGTPVDLWDCVGARNEKWWSFVPEVVTGPWN